MAVAAVFEAQVHGHLARGPGNSGVEDGELALLEPLLHQLGKDLLEGATRDVAAVAELEVAVVGVFERQPLAALDRDRRRHRTKEEIEPLPLGVALGDEARAQERRGEDGGHAAQHLEDLGLDGAGEGDARTPRRSPPASSGSAADAGDVWLLRVRAASATWGAAARSTVPAGVTGQTCAAMAPKSASRASTVAANRTRRIGLAGDAPGQGRGRAQLARDGELPLDLDGVGHIAERGDDPLAAVGREARQRHLDIDLAAVAAQGRHPRRDLEDSRRSTRLVATEPGIESLVHPFRHERREWPVDELVAGPAEQVFERSVDVHDAAEGISGDDPVSQSLEDGRVNRCRQGFPNVMGVRARLRSSAAVAHMARKNRMWASPQVSTVSKELSPHANRFRRHRR
jgi:hypothetical protein